MNCGSRVVYVHLDELAYFILSIELVTRGGGVLPYVGYIGMCRSEGYGF